MKSNKLKWITLYATIIVVCLVVRDINLKYKKGDVQHMIIPQKENPTIAILGDSWVANNNLDSLIRQSGREVVSLGTSGARSREVYASIFKSNLLENSPEYCIMTPSVNDLCQLMGIEYYVYHNMLTIELLLANGIKPVVVTMPKIDMEGVMSKKRGLGRIRTLISTNLKGTYSTTIPEYRKALENALKEKGIFNDVILVDFDKVSPVYDRMLYKDDRHLNEEGKQKLVSVIIKNLK